MKPTPDGPAPTAAIAGDFFALLARHRSVAPAAVTTTSASPEQTQATTVFAFHYRDGVLMAGDRRATAGNVIVTDRVDKVLELDATSLLAVAGVPAMAFEIARVLRTSFEYYRRSQLQPLSLPARVRALSRCLRDNLALTLQGVGLVAPLFVGLDASASPGRPQIFFCDPLGAEFDAVAFAASGSGATTIRSILSFQQRFGTPPPAELPLAAAGRFAHQLLMVASEFDAATGGVAPEAARFATIKTLTSDGVRTVTDAEQAGWLA